MSACDFALGFDADDTLWHNETIFEEVHLRYFNLLSRFHDAETVERRLFTTEMRNLERYGYGIKGFMLSAIETAIEISEGKINAGEIQAILDLGRDMLDHPVHLLDHVAETIAALADAGHPLVLITKGDLRDQERKLAKSGLSGHFRHIEIVSEKKPAVYDAIFRRLGVPANRFLMVGNSLKSDILPVLDLGASAIHIPYHLTWEHEHAEPPPAMPGRFFTAASIREVPALVASWSATLS